MAALDVLLLSDIFEEFRKMCLDEDGLDPVNYVGLPSFTWDSAFKFTGAKIHLLTDPEMYRYFETGIRGGMVFVNQHRVTADEQTQLLYIDANNLYGKQPSATSQKTFTS